MRVLVVEDDRHLADVVRRGLCEEGHVVELSVNGDDALVQGDLEDYDAIILDVMLPGKNGLEVSRELRRGGVTTPILMLTARDTVDDTVLGLEAGADDYLTKPFAFRELRARLQTLMRRAAGSSSPELKAGNLVLDLPKHEARVGSKRLDLTLKEYQLLEYLMHNPGRVLSRTMIEEHVWGYDYEGFSNTVDVHIRRLRQKIDPPGGVSLIETIRGVGYRLVQSEP